jgi:hypothetical protein
MHVVAVGSDSGGLSSEGLKWGARVRVEQMPDHRRIPVAVSTVYDSISSDAIDCVQFVVAVEEGLSGFPGVRVRQFGTEEDHFFVHLGFEEINDKLRAISVVVGFHAIESFLLDEADYFLRQYTGHFIAGEEAGSAPLLVEAVYEEITRRVEQGWLEP